MMESEELALHKENEHFEKLVSSLEGQLAWLRKKVFGSISEKHLLLSTEELQLNIFLD